ncbi:MAG: hypothetical protein MZV63_65900 [Marinilabiliales bacterium]|nr:hypothetical protein [Marinilabiliales bacterium]
MSAYTLVLATEGRFGDNSLRADHDAFLGGAPSHGQGRAGRIGLGLDRPGPPGRPRRPGPGRRPGRPGIPLRHVQGAGLRPRLPLRPEPGRRRGPAPGRLPQGLQPHARRPGRRDLSRPGSSGSRSTRPTATSGRNRSRPTGRCPSRHVEGSLEDRTGERRREGPCRGRSRRPSAGWPRACGASSSCTTSRASSTRRSPGRSAARSGPRSRSCSRPGSRSAIS